MKQRTQTDRAKTSDGDVKIHAGQKPIASGIIATYIMQLLGAIAERLKMEI